MRCTKGVLAGRRVSAPLSAFSDDFDRADGSLGSNWSDSGTVSIVSGKASTPAVTASQSIWNTETTTTTQYSEVPLILGSDATASPWVRAATTGGQQGYTATWNPSNNRWELYQVHNGTPTLIANRRLSAGVVPPSAGSRIRLRATNGPSGAVYLDVIEVLSGGSEVPRLAFTDTSGTKKDTQKGVGFVLGGGSAVAATIEDWEAGDWVVPSSWKMLGGRVVVSGGKVYHYNDQAQTVEPISGSVSYVALLVGGGGGGGALIGGGGGAGEVTTVTSTLTTATAITAVGVGGAGAGSAGGATGGNTTWNSTTAIGGGGGGKGSTGAENGKNGGSGGGGGGNNVGAAGTGGTATGGGNSGGNGDTAGPPWPGGGGGGEGSAGGNGAAGVGGAGGSGYTWTDGQEYGAGGGGGATSGGTGGTGGAAGGSTAGAGAAGGAGSGGNAVNGSGSGGGGSGDAPAGGTGGTGVVAFSYDV